MPCFKPQYAYRKDSPNSNGKFELTWNYREADLRQPLVVVPCGGCIGCKLEYARSWAMRCMNEASLYDDNIFVTLTYNESNLPSNGKLRKEDFQGFIKRLRRKLGPLYGVSFVVNKIGIERLKSGKVLLDNNIKQYRKYKPCGVRYFYCGEYGDMGKRPHYHAILFNYSPSDMVKTRTDSGSLVNTSMELSRLWCNDKGESLGFVSIGEVNYETCSYVARYVLKKLDVMDSKEKYEYLKRLSNGEGDDEYVGMSNKPGIGALWLDKYSDDVYSQDFVMSRDKYKCKPPRYYDKRYGLTNPERLSILKEKRRDRVYNKPDLWSRLRRREKYRMLVTKKLRREYHGEKSIQCV